MSMSYPLLEQIDRPADLRLLSTQQLPQVCDELRQCLLEKVARTGGHLASGLGVVELTVAIHYVFDTPNDHLLWDVGHQAYPHKILTARRDSMHTIRKSGGLSGFPKRDESPYDDFGVGHSSTSISAALGMAIVDRLNGRQNAHIAVIGDGAMTAGMAFEALHHAAAVSSNILLILNDNEMSISPNVGGLSSYLSRMLSSDLYHRLRNTGKQALKAFLPLQVLAKCAENRFKSFAGACNLFENFGFHYTGPQDGHDVLALVDILRVLKVRQGPKILHIKTIKGRGYQRAEDEPVAYHGVSGFDVSQGLVKSNKASPVTFTQVFSSWLCECAAKDQRLIAITPAMREGSGLVEFSNCYPERYFDVAIAEQHAVTLAAGMACKGAKPVVAIYSTFLQRAYDQLIHDVALQNLDVLFAVDRAGIVGEDGATHAGVFDIAYARLIPNMVIMTPSDADEMILALNTAYHHQGPALVRYPKGGITGMTVNPNNSDKTIVLGKGRLLQHGKELAILVFGTLLADVRSLADDYQATLVDMRFAKPLDGDLITDIALSHRYVLVIEEGVVLGGVGEQVRGMLQAQNPLLSVSLSAIADRFVNHGSRAEILAQHGLDRAGFQRLIEALISPSIQYKNNS